MKTYAINRFGGLILLVCKKERDAFTSLDFILA